MMLEEVVQPQRALMSAIGLARIEAYMGESGSGKSSRMKARLVAARPSRLVVWDPKREYAGFGSTVDSLEQLARGMLAAPAFRLVFRPQRYRKAMRKQFDVFCKLADRARQLTVVADELADVTEPNWAPEGWEMLTRQGRHAGIVVMGASQSPTDLDKTFFGNCSLVNVFRLGDPNHIERMAKTVALDRPAIVAARSEIAQLADHESLTLTKYPRSVKKIKTSARELSSIP